MAWIFRRRLIAEAIASGDVLQYAQVQMEGTRISDGLKDELHTLKLPDIQPGGRYNKSGWHLVIHGMPDPILINAPTGSGKTTFILHDLAKKAAEKGLYVLFLSNRSALALQQRYALMKENNIPLVGADILSNISLFNNVFLLTYQSVLYHLENLSQYPIGIVVFDEAHFFCSDSIFNAQTEQILTRLLDKFWNCQRIYMSATPDDVKSVIAYEEGNLYSRIKNNPKDLRYLRAANIVPSIREYYMPADYSYIRLHFFHRFDSILSLISESNSENKWLIFIESKDRGDKLKHKIGSDAIFVDASIREREPHTLESLVRTERFEKKVLIATSVLNNGINFYDPMLKNIVIESSDPVQIKQMLGRKRIQPGEVINLYIKERTKVEIERNKTYDKTLLKLLEEFFYLGDDCIMRRWGSLTESQQRLFYLDYGKAITYDCRGYQVQTKIIVANNYSEFQLARRIGRAEAIDARFAKEGEDAFAAEVCQWFGLTYTPGMQIDLSAPEVATPQIKVMVEQYVGKKMTRETARKFVRNAIEILQSVGLKKSTIGIKDTTEDVKFDINKILMYYDLPYECKKAGAEWEIVPKSAGNGNITREQKAPKYSV